MDSGRPTTRFHLVSRGIGKLAGGITMLVMGLVLLFFNTQVGQSLLACAALYLLWGIVGIVLGTRAASKRVTCPHCGEANELLADVGAFKCQGCEKPLKLQRRQESP